MNLKVDSSLVSVRSLVNDACLLEKTAVTVPILFTSNTFLMNNLYEVFTIGKDPIAYYLTNLTIGNPRKEMVNRYWPSLFWGFLSYRLSPLDRRLTKMLLTLCFEQRKQHVKSWS